MTKFSLNQSVLCIQEDFPVFNEIGVVRGIDLDDGDLMYRVKFPVDRNSWWFGENDLRELDEDTQT